MKLTKRVMLFVGVNILIVGTISVLMAVFNVQPYLTARGINYESLLIFCALWGFGGAFISLALSRVMAKWMMGVKVIDASVQDPELRSLVQRVHEFARRAGLEKMPEVGVYDGAELNAFATGPSKSRSLVAVSSGLLSGMNRKEVDGVLAHEVAHIANGDMVTMTLVQGVVNVFVMFLARVIGFFASQFVAEERRWLVQFVVVIALEIALGILGMMVVGFFSRQREYRADAGGASLAGRENMVAALERLKLNYGLDQQAQQASLATLKISGKSGGLLRFISTHPALDDRIQRLRAI
jgi:heat shock protein HtpX